jgi:hypothetical protein
MSAAENEGQERSESRLDRRLDLPLLPLAFSQTDLMTFDRFLQAAGDRGDEFLRREHLEALHQAGMLRPLYRLAKDVRAARVQARHSGTSVANLLVYAQNDAASVRAAREQGRLKDPRDEPFRRWERYRLSTGERPGWASEFLYSPFQLLGIDQLDKLRGRMRARRVGSDRLHYRLSLTDLDRELIGSMLPTPGILNALIALSSMYLPDVVEKLVLPAGGGDAWDAYAASFKPKEMLEWLELTPQQVSGAAEGFLMRAHALDPLGDWWRLVRLGSRDRWDRLKGAALSAVDHRVAAEILLCFHEHLHAEGAAPALEDIPPTMWHPRRDRIGPSRSELDGVLTEFGVSPHPSVVLALEGDTEMTIVPLVMDELSLERRPSLIKLVDAQGVQQDLSLLATYAVAPELGQRLEGGLLLTRPLTRFIVAFDAEHDYASAESRERQRQVWIDRIMEAMPADMRSARIRQQIESLVEVDSWNDQVFEFSHFTNREIAVAVNRLLRKKRPGAKPVTAADVQRVRSSRTPNVEHVYQRYRLSKVDLALEMWTFLQRRIRRADTDEDLDAIPVVKVVRRAYRLALATSRRSYMLATGSDYTGEDIGAS